MHIHGFRPLIAYHMLKLLTESGFISARDNRDGLVSDYTTGAVYGVYGVLS